MIFLTIISYFLFPNLAQANNDECVILLHGLSRSHLTMWPLESMLKKHHYTVVNRDYPSNRKSIEAHAEETVPEMVNECLKYHPKHIDFVTHSIGGVIVQTYLQKKTIPQLRSVVMLGPPNHGSPWVGFMRTKWLVRFVLGPAGEQLAERKKPPLLKSHPYKIGIIAGNFNINPFGYLVFHEANDGKVAVSSARLSQMDDFIVLPVTHTFMMMNPTVEKQILYFLEHGRFNKVNA